MDTSKPPLICDTCGEAISPLESFRTAIGTRPSGEVVGVIAYHQDCATTCATCNGSGVQEADELGREGLHVCLDCDGVGLQAVRRS